MGDPADLAAARAQSAILDGISCASPLDCTAVGSFTNTAGAAFPLTESRSQAIWSMQQPPSAVVVEPGTLNAVSCTSPGSCVSVGSVNGTSMTTLTLAEAWDGMTWSVQTTANPVVTPVLLQVSLDAVSCASQTACTAIGGGPHDDPLLVERWDGANWTVQSTPTTSDATTLDAISCPTPTACTAVGGRSTTGAAAAWSIGTVPCGQCSSLSQSAGSAARCKRCRAHLTTRARQ